MAMHDRLSKKRDLACLTNVCNNTYVHNCTCIHSNMYPVIFCINLNLTHTVYAIYFGSLIFRESGLQDIFASG